MINSSVFVNAEVLRCFGNTYKHTVSNVPVAYTQRTVLKSLMLNVY